CRCTTRPDRPAAPFRAAITLSPDCPEPSPRPATTRRTPPSAAAPRHRATSPACPTPNAQRKRGRPNRTSPFRLT
ncbi:hypothetical protein, partial [Sphingobium yanoikuyae]|uniref:hypothetical protein n=1 Tax=Sphingobium yanoikuyae TaxID=13690 RepID=UPI0026EE9C7C